MRWIAVLFLLANFGTGSPLVQANDDQLVAMVVHRPSAPHMCEIWPLGRWRHGKMEDISHGWTDEDNARGAWQKLPSRIFPLKGLMPFTIYANGRKAETIHPDKLVDWDCGLGTGLTVAQAPWPQSIHASRNDEQEWVALSHPTSDLGAVTPLSSEDAFLLTKILPGLAKREMRKKWADQTIGKLIRFDQTLFPLDRSGARGIFARFEFEGTNGASLVASLILDASKPKNLKLLHAEMGDTAGESEVMDSRLIGAFDLDGSGSAAVLEETGYYEDTGYAILVREGDHYAEVYRGSTYGE